MSARLYTSGDGLGVVVNPHGYIMLDLTTTPHPPWALCNNVHDPLPDKLSIDYRSFCVGTHC